MAEHKSDNKVSDDEEKGGPIPIGKNLPKTPFNTPVMSKLSKPVQQQDRKIANLTPEDIETPEKFVESLQPAVRARVQVIQGLQTEYDKLEDQFQKEIKELEKKYEALWNPLLQRRSEIVTGEKDVTADEVTKVSPDATNVNAPATEGPKGVPEFWLRALKNCYEISEQIQEKDDEALKFLTDIKANDLVGDQKGFKLEFFFAENPFFTNNVLSKTYIYAEENGEEVFDKAEGTEIQWKEGKNLTVREVKKKQRQKGGKNTRTVTKQEPCDSFFNFFKPINPEDLNEEDMQDEERIDEFEQLMEADHELGETIKEKLLPKAVDYYTGAASQLMDLATMGEYFDDEDDDENDDDDDDEHPQPQRGGGGKKKSAETGAKPPVAGENPPECKNQ